MKALNLDNLKNDYSPNVTIAKNNNTNFSKRMSISSPTSNISVSSNNNNCHTNIEYQDSRNDFLMENQNNRTYIKLRIFPVIPMQIQALYDLISEYFDHALILYCIDRLYSSISYPYLGNKNLISEPEKYQFHKVMHTFLRNVKPLSSGSSGVFEFNISLTNRLVPM